MIHHLRPGDLVRVRGERWRVSQCLPCGDAAIVDAGGCDSANRGVRASFLLPFEPVARVDTCRRPRTVRPPEWRLLARRTLGDATATSMSLRAAARARFDLVPFQLEPAIAMLRGDGCRFLIADSVGLGKTVQAGLMVAETFTRQPDARAIVIAPAGLRDQWCDEMRSRFGIDGVVMDAAGVARAVSQLPIGLNPWSTPRLVITSIDYVKRPEVLRCLEPLLWDVVVLDEAHALAGRSDRAGAAAAIAGRGRCVVMLTATPHSGDAGAFERLCDIGRHREEGPLLLFGRSHTDAGVTGARRTLLLRVRPTAAERAMHDALAEYASRVWRHTSGTDAARLAISVLARRAASSAASFTISVERRIALLDGGERASSVQLELPLLSSAQEDDAPDWQLAGPGLANRDDEIAELRRLRGLAAVAAQAESKLKALSRLVARIHEPAIVFTEYRDTLRHIASTLAPVKAVHLHGGLTSRQRADAIHEFTSGSARVLLATDAASEGLNLHHGCRLVINLELPWTPLRLEQRAGRVDRIGQRRRVHVVHLVAKATSEERVLARLAERVSTVRDALGPFAYASLPVDRAVAETVFGGVPLPDRPAVSADLAGVRRCSLQSEAVEEASRIHTARALLARAAATRIESPRPVRTSLRSTPLGSHKVLLVFRLLLIGSDNRELRQELLPLATGRIARDPDDPEVRAAIERLVERRLAAFALDTRRAVELGLGREARLSDALRREHARLSSHLIQSGLFDHRRERAAAAQSALLELALSQSDERQAHLTARLTPRVDSCDLVFAVAFA